MPPEGPQAENTEVRKEQRETPTDLGANDAKKEGVVTFANLIDKAFQDAERREKDVKNWTQEINKNLVQLGIILPTFVTYRDRLRFFSVYHATYGRFDSTQQRYLLDSVWRRTLQRFLEKPGICEMSS